jgi:hypothetical protein
LFLVRWQCPFAEVRNELHHSTPRLHPRRDRRGMPVIVVDSIVGRRSKIQSICSTSDYLRMPLDGRSNHD